MPKPSYLLLAIVLTAQVAEPAAAQSDQQFWRNQWFWGAQAGAFIFSAGGNQEIGLGVGGHWFITADHTALNVSFDQLIFTGSQVALGTGQAVDFSRAQRISATVNAMPGSGALRPFIGLGFAIQHVTNSAPQGPFATPQAQTSANLQVEELATKAFLILGGGIQWRLVDKWVIFGQYQFQPSTNDFLITSGQHVIQGGLRFALTGSKEEVDSTR
jgi:hypothetical protein